MKLMCWLLYSGNLFFSRSMQDPSCCMLHIFIDLRFQRNSMPHIRIEYNFFIQRWRLFQHSISNFWIYKSILTPLKQQERHMKIFVKNFRIHHSLADSSKRSSSQSLFVVQLVHWKVFVNYTVPLRCTSSTFRASYP